MTKPMPDYLTTREVADLIRLKERKVYDLVATGAIPCVRVTGKLLFPRSLIDAWLARHAEYGGGAETLQRRPNICAGSHDPLLDWALREAGTDLAVSFGGSLSGLERLAGAHAQMAGVHLPEERGGGWNVEHVKRALPGQPVVLIEWARRQQGLIVAPGNPFSSRASPTLRAAVSSAASTGPARSCCWSSCSREAGLGLDDLEARRGAGAHRGRCRSGGSRGRADAGLGIAAVGATGAARASCR